MADIFVGIVGDIDHPKVEISKLYKRIIDKGMTPVFFLVPAPGMGMVAVDFCIQEGLSYWAFGNYCNVFGAQLIINGEISTLIDMVDVLCVFGGFEHEDLKKCPKRLYIQDEHEWWEIDEVDSNSSSR